MARRLFDSLPAHASPVDDKTTVYKLAELQAVPDAVVTKLTADCFLAVLVVDDLHVSFGMFEWHNAGDGGVFIRLVFKGEGLSGNLREMRHTWWVPDEDGYVFYLPIDGVIAAMTALKAYFDDK